MKINMKIENKDIKRVVPPLRFPEFRDAEGWEEESVEAVLDNQSSQIALKNIEFVQKGYPVYGADGSVGLTHDYSLSKDYISIVKDGSGVGRLMLRKGKSSILSTLNSLTSKDETTYKLNWLYYLMQTINLSSYVKGSGIPHIYYADYKKHLIYVPKPAEQTKIADCLSSLDDLISAVTDKIETLKEYKKGLMQQLFPAEGKTTPTLRFPEFQNAGEWRQTTVENICEMQAGKFVSASDIYEKRESEMYPCYGGNGLRGYTYSFTHSGIYLLIGRQGALCGNVTFVDGTFHATEHAVVVTCKEGIVPHWLYYQFTKSNLNQYATGQAQPGLSVEVIKKVDVSIPKDNNKQIRKGEQQKIADCLSSVDELIFAQADKLEQLKAHKKGLMQQLFPTLTNRL